MSGGTPARPDPEATIALLALVAGVLGLVGDLLAPILGLVLGAIGITFGLRGRDSTTRRTVAIAGIVLGAVAIVVGIVLLLLGPVAPTP